MGPRKYGQKYRNLTHQGSLLKTDTKSSNFDPKLYLLSLFCRQIIAKFDLKFRFNAYMTIFYIFRSKPRFLKKAVLGGVI
jgi:hypothetical protein